MSKIFENKRISLGLLFIIGAFCGALCFIGVYGIRVLDFTNVGWLFYAENDLRQHYIAWCHFRSDPWNFPLGLVNSLSDPNSISVIYTDSIPIFAVFFKLFRAYMPVNFQYFGLFGILSFMLMGGFSCILLRRFINNDFVCVLGSLFYILSFPVLFRMFYHTALASQWFIIACLVLWVYDDIIKSKRLKCLYWGLIGFLCVGIHSYFLPMCGMVLAVLMITQFAKGERALPILEFISFVILGLVNLVVLGGFVGSASGYGKGLGTFGSNLNTFVNPVGMGRLLPTLPLYYEFQYEGMAYLGAGVIFLFIVIAAGLVVRAKRKITEEAFHSKKIYAVLSLILMVASALAAILPLISFGDIKILQIPYPGFVEKVLGIFRSNGRLIWVAFYMILTAAVSITAYTFRNNVRLCVAVFAAALLIQGFDMSTAVAEKHEYFTFDFPVTTMWDEPELAKFVEGKDEFLFLYTDNDITLLTAYYGYLHGMKQNNYYFARDIDEQVEKEIEKIYKELEAGKVRENAVYILKEEDFMKSSKLFGDLDMQMLMGGGHVVLVK